MDFQLPKKSNKLMMLKKLWDPTRDDILDNY